MKKTVPKKADIILFFAVTVAAAVFFLFAFFTRDGEYAAVYVDGDLVGRYALDSDVTVNVPCADGGYNAVTVADGRVYVSDADCPDRTCVRSGAVSKTGQSIICLPHRLMIVIEGAEENEVDAELY